MDSIGAYEAKTHLPRLLNRIARGESVTITRHGQVVAYLVPAEKEQRGRRQASVASFDRRREQWRGGATTEEILRWRHEGHGR